MINKILLLCKDFSIGLKRKQARHITLFGKIPYFPVRNCLELDLLGLAIGRTGVKIVARDPRVLRP